MICKDCLKNDVCGKQHKIEHPDENGVEYTCGNFLSGERNTTRLNLNLSNTRKHSR